MQGEFDSRSRRIGICEKVRRKVKLGEEEPHIRSRGVGRQE